MFNSEKMLADLRKMIPPLSDCFHKGQAGRIGIIGGSEKFYRNFLRNLLIFGSYTGAPYFSCMSSMVV